MKVHEIDVHPALPERIAWLNEIARNVWSAWSPEAGDLFSRLDPEAWEDLGHNPVALLRQTPQERLDRLAADESFVAMVARVARRLDAYANDPGWLVPAHPEAAGMLVAYFSLEFGLDAGIPLYSGGLGILAGDHLKSASDLGVPLVGVGLLYRGGYFRQSLGPDGGQRERYPETDWANLPLVDQLDPAGEPLVVEVEIGEEAVRAAVRRIQVGRVPLLLLDSDIEGNSPEARGITNVLYGGGRDQRMRQEVLLGIGGVRALAGAGMAPTVFHMNEGHSALLVLERLRAIRAETGATLPEAMERVVASTVFTTHTPVPAGNETFDPELARTFLEPVAAEAGMTWEELAALASHPDEGETAFGMTPLALRTSGFANGVAELHGDTSRRMWQGLWPKLPLGEVPITSITNGIHTASWLSREMHELLDRYVGPGLRERPEDPTVWERAETIPSGELWRVHELRRERLVLFARERLSDQLARQGSRKLASRAAGDALRPDALTICFARRFATYKRADLLFRDPDRLARLLSDEKRPVQIIIAGKAHPLDTPGKDVLRTVVQESQRPRLRDRVVFLEDYDMHVARYLVQGADVWLNVPRRPLEASGTSGMKAAVNGALNLSVLDGWWAEGYAAECGWAIGSGEQYDDPEENDAVEAEALYTLLEREVVPAFYARDSSGRPREWTSMMTASIRRLGAEFNTGRMVREYAERAYMPAHAAAAALSERSGAGARDLAAWRERMAAAWPQVGVRIGGGTNGSVVVGSDVEVELLATLGPLSVSDVRVELVTGVPDGDGGLRVRRVVPAVPAGAVGQEQRFVATMPAAESGRLAYAARVVPLRPDGARTEPQFLIAWEPPA
jgi:glycogen phosphorylase